MLDISKTDEPHEIDLSYKVKVTVKPLTTPSYLAAQSRARKMVKEEQGHIEDTEERQGMETAYLIYALAEAHITDWNLTDTKTGEKFPITPESIRALMDKYPVGEEFLFWFRMNQRAENIKKKDLETFAAGTSNEAAAQNTAKDAKA